MIKWEDIKLGASPITNNIYIGKTKVDKDGLEMWTDRSGDKTQDVLKAVLDWFYARHKYEKKDSVQIEVAGKRYILKFIMEEIEVENEANK